MTVQDLIDFCKEHDLDLTSQIYIATQNGRVSATKECFFDGLDLVIDTKINEDF